MSVQSFKSFTASQAKSIAVTFGRFQPPTIGHQKLIDATAKASPSSYRIYTSQTNDPVKNPLTYNNKISFLRKMFPRHGRNIIKDESIKNILDVACQVANEGFTKLIVVVGQDRVEEIRKLLTKYEDVKLSTGSSYSFSDGIEVISAGERDPDSDSIEGMSASKMRKAAIDDDYSAFAKGLPATFKEGPELYNALRKAMGLRESIETHVGPKIIVTERRDEFYRGTNLNVGSHAVDALTEEIVSILSRGPNFVVAQNASGETSKRWIKDVAPLSEGWATDAWTKVVNDKFAKSSGRKLQGFLYIGRDNVQEELTKKSDIVSALNNLDKLDDKYSQAFEVFSNPNDMIVFKQNDWTPHFYLI